MLLRAETNRSVLSARRNGAFDMVKAAIWVTVAALPWAMLAWLGRVL